MSSKSPRVKISRCRGEAGKAGGKARAAKYTHEQLSRMAATKHGKPVEVPASALDSFVKDVLDGLEEIIARGPEFEARFRVTSTPSTRAIFRLLDDQQQIKPPLDMD